MAIKVFLSYAHQDEPLLQSLVKHLQGLQRQGSIDVWYDRDLRAGAERQKEIDKNLNTAQMILLLISPDFMASDYCYSKEMIRAVERHEQGEACVIPVILRHVDWTEKTPFAQLEVLPTYGQPVVVSDGYNVDEALYDVAKGIRRSLESLLTKPATGTNRDQEKLSTLPSSLPPGENHLYPTSRKRPRSTRERPNDQPFSPAQQSAKIIETNASSALRGNSGYVIYICPNCSEQRYLGDCAIW
jgi:hypothetical protein